MHAKLTGVRCLLPLLFLLLWPGQFLGRSAPAAQDALTPDQAQAQVEQALAVELTAVQDKSHPMRYRLRKSSPRFTSTKEVLETSEGAVARLVSIGDKPLNPEEEQREQSRLDELLSDPGRQKHRKQSEEEDTARALRVLRALPRAFLYQFEGTAAGAGGTVQKFTFKPNPDFSPSDLETPVLTAMSGEICIDATQHRVTRLEGHLQQDVDFGWGILGKLDKGGWIVIEQADLGGGIWRIARFQMVMNGRMLFKTKAFDTVEEQTQFAPLPANLSLEDAVRMLRGPGEGAAHGDR